MLSSSPDSDPGLSLLTIPAFFLKYAPWVIIFLFFLFGALTIMDFPPVHYLGDEIGMMETGANFMDEHKYSEPQELITARLYYATLWGIGKVIGVGIWQSRVLSLIYAVFVLLIVYLLGRELSGPYAGLLALVLITSDYSFSWNARLIRPEMMSILFVLGSFAAMVYTARRPRFKGSLMLLLFSALTISLSINVHPNNLQYIVAICFLYPVLYRDRLRSKETLMFLAGLLGGVLLWMLWSSFVFYSGQAGQAGQYGQVSAQAGIIAGSSVSPFSIWSFPFLKENFFSLFINSLNAFGRDYIVQYLKMADSTFPNHVSFTYYASLCGIGILMAMFTGARRTVFMLVGFPALALFVNYFLTKKFGYWHMVEVHPFLALAAAIGVCSLSGKIRVKGIEIALIVVFICALPLVGYWDQAKSVAEFSSRYNYDRLLKGVSSSVPDTSGAPVMGHVLYAPGFMEHSRPYIPLGFDVERTDGSYRQCEPLWQRVKSAGAGYLIMDDILRGMMQSACSKMYVKDSLRWLSLNARLITHINEPYPNFWAPRRILKDSYVYEINSKSGDALNNE